MDVLQRKNHKKADFIHFSVKGCKYFSKTFARFRKKSYLCTRKNYLTR